LYEVIGTNGSDVEVNDTVACPDAVTTEIPDGVVGTDNVVVANDAVLAFPVSTALVAVTVNVYVVLGNRLDIIIDVDGGVVVPVNPPGELVAV
jgi:hypothetical protein